MSGPDRGPPQCVSARHHLLLPGREGSSCLFKITPSSRRPVGRDHLTDRPAGPSTRPPVYLSARTSGPRPAMT